MTPAIVEATNIGAVTTELRSRLMQFNERHAGPLGRDYLALTINGEDGAIVAGLSGETFWNTLYVDLLWVDEAWRSRGYGRQLLQRAENWALTRRCDTAFLSTFSFQAPGFYQKQGYSKVGELVDSPRGAGRFWFAKHLRA